MLLKFTSDTWTNWGAENWSSIPTVKLAGWSWDSTSQTTPFNHHPRDATCRGCKAFQRGVGGRPHLASGGWLPGHGEDQRDKEEEKKCAWGQNTRQTGHSVPNTAPHGGPWCYQKKEKSMLGGKIRYSKTVCEFILKFITIIWVFTQCKVWEQWGLEDFKELV